MDDDTLLWVDEMEWMREWYHAPPVSVTILNSTDFYEMSLSATSFITLPRAAEPPYFRFQPVQQDVLLSNVHTEIAYRRQDG